MELIKHYKTGQKMKTAKCLLMVLTSLFMFSGYVLAENVPYIFSSGQVASASQVNQNFKYLIDRDREYTVLFDGVAVGYASYVQGAIMSIKTFKGFDIAVDKAGVISPKQIYYKSSDCSGTPYFYIDDGNRKKFFFTGRRGIVAPINGVLYYSDVDGQLYGFTSYSRSYNGNCSESTTPGVFVIAYENDANITGVNSYPVPLPITVQGETLNTIINE